jgi:hypothetical protein
MTHNDSGLAMWRKSLIRQAGTDAKYITKSSILILLPGVILQPELKPNSNPIAEDMFVQPPYCQTALLPAGYFIS